MRGTTLSNTYIEVRIKACTGEYTILKCDTGDFLVNRREATQIASIVSMLVRTGRTVGQFRSTAPEDWFGTFSEHAHVTEVKVSRVRVVDSYLDRLEVQREVRDPLLLRTTLSDSKYSCEHVELVGT